MDAGAHGVIVPMVNSAIEAKRAVEAVRYPPEGKRGVGLARAPGYGSAFERYRQWLDRESVVIVQVEHIEAVNELKEILSVDNVDGFIVGPYDLSGSLGVPGQLSHPAMKDAMDRILSISAATGKVAGIHIVEPDISDLQKGIDQGYSFVAYSVDIRMLDSICRLGIDAIRKKMS
jgi:2-dehydro-3-deoxyglucarate aldolase